MNNIIQTPIIQEVEQSFLDYSLSVITDRAIPSAEDGLKPVARRILWDMFDKGYMNNKKVVKCAQPVGDTMGRFHPHGDSSIYGALVWLSQPWNMRYPLIFFHGNNGSRDGDEPAAYRYTECKLSKMGEEMLSDIKKNAVDWQLAYTDEEEEPIYLPGRIPNLLVNGTSGIAVAMACSFAPHNLNEIMDAACHVLNNPKCDVKDLLEFVKGPDFPTGGLVINKDELATAYTTGKGRARIRAEYKIESSKSGKDCIVYTSMPYKVSKSDLITEIDKLCEEKKIDGISAIRDESGNGEVRFVIELEKDVSTELIVTKLFKLSRLEDTYSYNQVALVNKEPRLLNLKQLLEIYITHQRDVLLRTTSFDAEKVKSKINILEGLLIALEDIDNVIALIKGSESATNAKNKLMVTYKLNEDQAKAILDMKLSKLAKLEKIELENEKKELIELLNKLNAILADPVPEMNRIFNSIKSTYGDNRRTTITQVTISNEEKEIEFVEPEKCVVIMTESGLIKRVPSTSFHAQKRNGKGVKTQEDIIQAVIRTNSVDSLMVFTDQGKMYRLPVVAIPEGTNTSKGQSIKSLVNMETGENPSIIYSVYRDTDAQYVLFATHNGQIKKTSLDEYIKTKKKSGVAAVGLRDADELACVTLVKDEELLVLTEQGMCIHFKSSEITPTGRITEGVKGITLNEGDKILTVLPIRDPNDQLAVFLEDGRAKQFSLTELPLQKRGGKGLMICPKGEKVAAATLISNEDNILICGASTSICVAANEIPSIGRIAAGNSMIKESKIISISKI